MKKVTVFAVIFICFYHNVYAQDISNSKLLEEIKKLKATIAEQGKRLSDLEYGA